MGGIAGAGMTHLQVATGTSNGGNSKVGKNQVAGQPGLKKAIQTGGTGLTPGLGSPKLRDLPLQGGQHQKGRLHQAPGTGQEINFGGCMKHHLQGLTIFHQLQSTHPQGLQEVAALPCLKKAI